MSFLTKLLEWGFQQNVWIFFHLIAGGVGANIAKRFMGKWQSVLAVFSLAFSWEVFEFFYDGRVQGMIEIYGSMERWFYDSLFDVVGAMIVALLCLF